MVETIARRGVLLGGMMAPLAVLAAAKPAVAVVERGLTTEHTAPAAAFAIDAGPALIPVTLRGKSALPVRTGVQFTGTLQPLQSNRWFTFNWPASWHVIWYAVSTTPRTGVIQVESSYAVERASAAFITYWITIRNLSNGVVDIEGRFAVLDQ
jgi:hypothetical protein